MRLPSSHRVDPTGTIRLVGMTFIASTVRRPESRGRGVRVRFVVDSGAVYSVLPEPVWKHLRLRPTRSAQFSLADGTVIARGVSRCTFGLAGVTETSPVVLGAPRDAPLLGMVTLEALGLMLNPLTRELLPMKLLLARLTRAESRNARGSVGCTPHRRDQPPSRPTPRRSSWHDPRPNPPHPFRRASEGGTPGS